jgi:hypothetical protein
MKAILLAVATVVVGVLSYQLWKIWEPGFMIPNKEEVAHLWQMQSRCESIVKDMEQQKFITDIQVAPDQTLDVTINDGAWAALTTDQRSSVASAIYCAKIPQTGLLIVAIRNSSAQLVWLTVNGKDQMSRDVFRQNGK